VVGLAERWGAVMALRWAVGLAPLLERVWDAALVAHLVVGSAREWDCGLEGGSARRWGDAMEREFASAEEWVSV